MFREYAFDQGRGVGKKTSSPPDLEKKNKFTHPNFCGAAQKKSSHDQKERTVHPEDEDDIKRTSPDTPSYPLDI